MNNDIREQHDNPPSDEWRKKVERVREFEKELVSLLNRYSMENDSDTPDFILAEYMMLCLGAWQRGVHKREQFYGRRPMGPSGQIA